VAASALAARYRRAGGNRGGLAGSALAARYRRPGGNRGRYDRGIDAPDRPIVLVHGFASSFDHNWRQTGWVDILSDLGRPVVGIDLLGHGTAPRPTDPAAYNDVAQRVLAALPAGVAVDAVGFSAGARILLSLALERPARFARLALLGVGDSLFEPGEPATLADALERGTPVDDVGITLFQRLAASAGNDPRALAAFMRRRQEPIDPGRLAAVRCPVLIVLGDRDTTASGASRLLDALPRARLVSLRGVDHFATPSDFGAIDAVVGFLEEPATQS